MDYLNLNFFLYKISCIRTFQKYWSRILDGFYRMYYDMRCFYFAEVLLNLALYGQSTDRGHYGGGYGGDGGDHDGGDYDGGDHDYGDDDYGGGGGDDDDCCGDCVASYN